MTTGGIPGTSPTRGAATASTTTTAAALRQGGSYRYQQR